MDVIEIGLAASALNLVNDTSSLQSPFIAPTLQNNWVDFGYTYATAGYMKDTSGYVHLKGSIKGGDFTEGTVIFNLPEGYRPEEDMVFTLNTRDVAGDAFFASAIVIRTNGNVEVGLNVLNGRVNLNTIIFFAKV